jgi:pimeloyl-ACP methyl ester carboxylesterase
MCGSTLKTEIYEVATGIHYEYVYVKANSNGTHYKPTLLFLHGFPSSFHCWQNQIEYFSRQGYGSLAPNMMGYGRTYSPLNKTEYRAKSMVNHLIALLDYLKIDKVFVIGHDWGTRPASRFALYYPERTLGLVLISIGYDQPSMFDLDQALKNTKEACGFELFGYWQFFSSDDAAKIIENNLESFIDILYSSNTTLFITDFAPVGKLREWLINKKRTDRASYMTRNDYKIVHEYLAHGMQSKLNWYKAAIDNVNWEDEKNIDPVIRQPFLFIQDAISNICLGSSLAKQRQVTPNSDVITLDTWHWVMQENPDAVNRAINEWIRKII